MDLGADIGPCPRMNLVSPLESPQIVKRPPFFGTPTMGAAQVLCETFWIMPSFFVLLLPNHIFDGKGLGLGNYGTDYGIK